MHQNGILHWQWQRHPCAIPLNLHVGSKGQALYSDTNYQLLGRIVELMYNDSLENIFQNEICVPLDLRDTYMYVGRPDQALSTLYFKGKPLLIPKAMSSVRADGGIVSTGRDSMIFIKSFFSGEIFPKPLLTEMCMDYRRVMFPLQYGTGVMRFKLPCMMTAFKDFPELLGHSGLTGAFAYYSPKQEIYFTGTVNQLDDPSLAYRMLVTVQDIIN